MPNRLANETSPYLLQHKDNPVDWYPWGEEAFAKARAEDKPILLSVGYSSCHWCHVMAHESFENEATAALMNHWFVNIKVDREERPDVDSVYMSAVQALTQSGGWPMTVFMTADGQPFYAGTYFPPADAYGRPGFPRVLEALHEAWINDRSQIVQRAMQVVGHLEQAVARKPAGGSEIAPYLADGAVEVLRDSFDGMWGGFGTAPKFPSPATLEFLLNVHLRNPGAGREGPPALEMVLHTLERMARGGIYDQLGGGFARYSVDERWLVPHFEKMLYDNAQLVRLYLHAWQLTRDPEHERIVRETLDWLEREMLDADGGWYAALDADSEGVEGKYYVWTVPEVEAALGDDAALFNAWFGVTVDGNFQDPHHPELAGRNVLTSWQDEELVAEQFGIPVADLAKRVSDMRERMLAVRDRRVRPGLDDKVLTSWNGLTLAALAEAGRVLGDAHYTGLARRTAVFLRERMWQDGRLLHSYNAGRAVIDGMLDDYAYVGLGLVELFKATGEIDYLEWGRDLLEVLLVRFRDGESGGFFATALDGEQLILRQKPYFDVATPAGNSAAALLGVWLGRYYGRPEWEALAQEVFNLVHDHAVAAASGFGTLWQCVEFVLAPHREVVISGEPSIRNPLERELAGRYLPFAVIAPTASGTGLPLFEGRDTGPVAVAYVCENMSCNLPVFTPVELAAQLG